MSDPSTGTRRGYHHGELRRALLAEGTALARAGGPAAVQLRDAARRAGVSHNAGYRHFADRDDYLDAVASAGMAELAEAMERAVAAVPGDLSVPDAAQARLAAVGGAYLDFALREPGLFRTAFATRGAKAAPTVDHGSRGAGGRDPYELLVAAIDGLVAAGLLPPERRDHSELVAWSAVHGLAELLLDGPLRGTPAPVVAEMWLRVGGAVLRGL